MSHINNRPCAVHEAVSMNTHFVPAQTLHECCFIAWTKEFRAYCSKVSFSIKHHWLYKTQQKKIKNKTLKGSKKFVYLACRPHSPLCHFMFSTNMKLWPAFQWNLGSKKHEAECSILAMIVCLSDHYESPGIASQCNSVIGQLTSLMWQQVTVRGRVLATLLTDLSYKERSRLRKRRKNRPTPC